jgi:protein SCO1/2
MVVVSRAQQIGLSALGFLIVVTVAWWALALWPAAAATPEWLVRARYVCFNTGPDGMPDASGWLLLIGQPIGMLAVLMVVWGDNIRGALDGLARRRSGRLVLAISALALTGGVVAAADRVAEASAAKTVVLPGDTILPDTYPRLNRTAPPLSLVDQSGQRVDLAELNGQPALVTFAFGNCHTVCPAIVRQTLAVREELAARAAKGALPEVAVPRVVIVSLDPWRDTPSRLSHLADHWALDEESYVLSGSVEEVESVLTDWNVARSRDASTGDILHPPLVYLVDASGQLAYATSGGTDAMIELVGRL